LDSVKEPSGLLIVRAAMVESLRKTVMVAEGIGCLPSVIFPVMAELPGCSRAVATGRLVCAKVGSGDRTNRSGDRTASSGDRTTRTTEKIGFFMEHKIKPKWF
jgi:hypothetical protein